MLGDSDLIKIVFISLYVLLAFGLGILLEDIGTLFELKLEEIYFKLKCNPRTESSGKDSLHITSIAVSIFKYTTAWFSILIYHPTVREWLLGCHLKPSEHKTSVEAKRAFYENWGNYLELSFSKKEEPVALRYYRSVLVRFKFEINMSAAFLLMLIGHGVLGIRYEGFFGFFKAAWNWDTLIYLIGILSTVSILIIEAFTMIELLDEIRIRLIAISERRKPKA